MSLFTCASTLLAILLVAAGANDLDVAVPNDCQDSSQSLEVNLLQKEFSLHTGGPHKGGGLPNVHVSSVEGPTAKMRNLSEKVKKLCLEQLRESWLGSILSAVGFGTCVLLFGLISFVMVGHYWDPLNIRNLPGINGHITAEEAQEYLTPKASEEKLESAKDFIASIAVIIRFEACMIMALTLGAAYALWIPYRERTGATVIYGFLSIFTLLMESNHAGFLRVGRNVLMTPNIQKGSNKYVFLWTVMCLCFWGSLLLA
mmetsp:Transcript_140607/g.255629  ORF Transcript_140607/g.255629 Transcript_140607/m.255629 type:complete len:258 (+) Transcript_140607:32-805(+)